MGENIYIDMSSNSRGFDPKKPVLSWYSEIKDFDSSSISEY